MYSCFSLFCCNLCVKFSCRYLVKICASSQKILYGFVCVRTSRFETLVKQNPMSEILFPEEQEGYKNYEDASTGEVAEDAVREVYLDERKRKSDATQLKIDDRVKFEERIRRPYFHVKPLDDAEVDNWHEYLEYEIQRGTAEIARILFERCLIPCALYSSFWQKYVEYLTDKKRFFPGADVVYSVYQRCTQYHCPRDAGLYLEWALRLECDEKLSESERVRHALVVLERAHLLCAASNPLISLRLLRVRSRMQLSQSSRLLNGGNSSGDATSATTSTLPVDQVSRLLSYAVDDEAEQADRVVVSRRLRNRLYVSSVACLARYYLKRLGNVEKAREIVKGALARQPVI